MPLVEIENLKFSYTQSVDSLIDLATWSLESGETRVIKGPSGCGKTTLLHLICGLRRPDEGTLAFNGRDLAKMSERQSDRLRAQEMGVVFQDFSLIPGFSVQVNLEIAAGISGRVEKKQIHETLDALGLSDKSKDSVSDLSRGERQRVAIARALLSGPRLLLADEPTASLDDARTEAVIHLFQEASERLGTSVLIATHDARVEQGIDGITEYWGSMTKGSQQ
ncbi:MAG: ATP-binding cassette domain-containing protein [Verrucomicrobiota bacterium]